MVPRRLRERILTIRRLTDRFPSTLAEDALTEFLRDGHFSAHIKRARKRVRAARDALVDALQPGPFAVSMPEQGLHLVAELPPGADDVSLAVSAPRHCRRSILGSLRGADW